MTNERNLLVVSGPSGIGKDTVVKHLVDGHENIELAVSATTRPPRPYEVNGQHYFFFSAKEFLEKVENDEFVEYTQYAGNYYGTLKSEVEKRVNNGKVCVLVIEVNGSAAIRRMYPDCTTVFIVAPNLEEHMRRLRGRGCESEEVMAERMLIAKKELSLAVNYDYQLVNDDAQECAQALYDILKSRQAEA